MQTIEGKPFIFSEFPKEKVNLVVFYYLLKSFLIAKMSKLQRLGEAIAQSDYICKKITNVTC